MDHEAVLDFAYDDSDSASLVERSVAQELDEIDGDRTRARIDRDDETLSITIEAADPVALRAGVTTWTTLVEVAERAGEI
ncbi:rpo operon protein [Halorhabdus tiamatea SARL4B]|uniref:Pcc1-type transcription factor-like protein n=1 Tax=Halorhabdus tiamatea SARL4B TaxID=1033806 RepID=F7PM34_9EURY|nr:KEOPS complex subunit Pcc1 [Halorhabdus tiamatea]ERJ06357.1 rpo operon protein [Halorhabdus tiamatea SARL4B]CCQ34525.1 Pcc1-type transcription factor-like protein [Halorhabdus tiamatea SARL4B]